MEPRFIITLTDNKLGKTMSLGFNKFSGFKRKTLSGKTPIYELLDKYDAYLKGTYDGKIGSSTPK